jgi:hypothetical protein
VTTLSNRLSPRRVRHWVQEQQRAYGREDGAVVGYLPLIGVYVLGSGAAAVAAQRAGRAEFRPGPWEMFKFVAATHKISRTLAKDPVTSPFRAPFTHFEGTSAPSELAESVRGTGVVHSVGELLTCPMCLGQWVATALSAGMVFAPALTRQVITIFAAVAGSDVLQHAYTPLQQAEQE